MNRAKIYAASLSAGAAYAQLRQRDEEERKIWVHRHRMSETMPLGKIAKQVFDENAKLWLPVHGGGSSSEPRPNAATGSGKEKAQAEQIAALKAASQELKRKRPAADGAKGGAKAGNPPKKPRTGGNPVTVDALLNGTALCSGYNKGTCNGATCPNGQKHACNGKLKNKTKSIACGRSHKSTECTVCLQR